MIVQQRTRFFLPVEGEGEQSFAKWLQELSNQNGLHIHLDCQPLGGGGYKTLLTNATRYRKQKERHKAKQSILLIDADRATNGDDGWTISQLREAAAKHKIDVCLQIPNQEGLFLRMMAGKESLQPDAANAKKQLRIIWPEYQKPVDTRTLATKFKLADLLRAAHFDSMMI